METKQTKQTKQKFQHSGEKIARGTLLLDFGKHKGTSFSDVYEQDPDYCKWFTKTKNMERGAFIPFEDKVKNPQGEIFYNYIKDRELLEPLKPQRRQPKQQK